MTGYPKWRKQQVQKKWRGMLAVFLTIVLVLAVINGVAKGIKLSKILGESRWDSRFPFVSVLGTLPPSVFILDKDPQKLVILKTDEGAYFETGKRSAPLSKLKLELEKPNGEELMKMLTLGMRAKIDNYVLFNQVKNLDEENTEDMFKSFASIVTPFVIISGKMDIDRNTNITRYDMLKLWWQLKGLGVDDIKIVDISAHSQEIITGDNQKVLGVDDTSLARLIRQYLEDDKVIREDVKISIRNSSGVSAAGHLAADIIESVGGRINRQEEEDEKVLKTTIASGNKNSYTAIYLAKIFNCDINVSSDQAFKGQIIVTVGQDFASGYFE